MEIRAYFETMSSVGPVGVTARGCWVTFPISEDGLITKFKETASDTDNYSRFMFRVKRWDVPLYLEEELSCPEGQLDLRLANSLAEWFKGVEESDIPIIKALLEADWDIEDACRIAVKKTYTDLRSQSDEDIIRKHLEANCDVPDFVLDHVNWSAVADDYFSNMDGYVYVSTGDKQGYIWVND